MLAIAALWGAMEGRTLGPLEHIRLTEIRGARRHAVLAGLHYSRNPRTSPAFPRRVYSRGWKPLPGTCQPRCSPPSNAIICPVIDGDDKM